MTRYRFDRFTLDVDDRRLSEDGRPVALSSRYFDALLLLVADAGRMVSKDRFLEQAWRGVPVTDEALTQCIRSLRRALGDDAARPRFIETVPKHGYRFVAAVEVGDDPDPVTALAAGLRATAPLAWPMLAGAGALGGAAAGLAGGLCYGLAAAGSAAATGLGSISVVLVLLWITLVVAAVGAGGVATGLALAMRSGRSTSRLVLGGAIGGMLTGGIVRLMGLDAFNLLLGRAPADITGGVEGLALGAAVGAGMAAALRLPRLRAGVAIAATIGGAAGALVPLAGGRLMAGSLMLLTDRFPESRLRLDPFGGAVLGRLGQSVTGALEGALFAACIVTAMLLAERRARAGAGGAGALTAP